jgi:hypothetical protein
MHCKVLRSVGSSQSGKPKNKVKIVCCAKDFSALLEMTRNKNILNETINHPSWLCHATLFVKEGCAVLRT